MARRNLRDQDLPPHIQEVVQSIAQIHVDHHENATPLERAIESVIGLSTRPRFLLLLSLGLLGWVALNTAVFVSGWAALDPPPFFALATAASLGSLYWVILILANQRREDQLAELRAQLTLELALLTEQKSAKLIQLLEELRRDIPIVQDRSDDQADAMAKPADPQLVVEAIKETTTAEAAIRNVPR